LACVMVAQSVASGTPSFTECSGLPETLVIGSNGQASGCQRYLSTVILLVQLPVLYPNGVRLAAIQ
jgi:hypothetical protein